MIIFLAAGCFLTLILFAVIAPGGLELKVLPVKGGPPLLVLPLVPGERFTLHYYHSVENAPIWEEHSLDEKGRIYIEEERYLKFGAGMGRMPGVGRMVRRGPYEVIEDMHMPTGNFVLRVGSPGVDHTVIWRGRSRNLSAVAPHVAVQFSARPVSLLYSLWRWMIPHTATPQQIVPNPDNSEIRNKKKSSRQKRRERQGRNLTPFKWLRLLPVLPFRWGF